MKIFKNILPFSTFPCLFLVSYDSILAIDKDNGFGYLLMKVMLSLNPCVLAQMTYDVC